MFTIKVKLVFMPKSVCFTALKTRDVQNKNNIEFGANVFQKNSLCFDRNALENILHHILPACPQLNKEWNKQKGFSDKKH